MSNHNYSQYSNKHKKQYSEPVIEERVETELMSEVDTAEPAVLMGPIEVIEERVKPVIESSREEGVVANCGKLNVRANPSTNAAVVCVLNANAKVGINVKKSNKEWFYVLTEDGIEGYCMKQYIDANL